MRQYKTIYAMLMMAIFITACSSGTENDTRPQWIDKASNLYPEQQFLSAVGEGSTRNLAAKNALANLTEIFSVNVSAETKSITDAVKKQSAVGVTSESATIFNRTVQTRTEQAVKGVEIKESWQSPQGNYYALAVLEKSSAADNLRSSITEMDKQSADYIDYSIHQAPNVIASINALRSARDLQMSRKMANVQLKYISGLGMGSDISSDKIEQLIRQKLAALEVSVEAEDKRTKKAIQSGLAAMGVKLVDSAAVKVVAAMDITEPVQLNSWYWLRGSIELSIVEQQQVISRKRWPVKVSAQQAEMLTPRLQDKLSQDIKGYLQQLVSDAPTL